MTLAKPRIILSLLIIANKITEKAIDIWHEILQTSAPNLSEIFKE